MDFLSRRDFKEKERREDEHKKKHAVFDRALDIAIRIEDRQELRAKARVVYGGDIKTCVAAATFPLLRIIATVVRDLPFRIEAIRTNRSVRRQKRTAKSRIGPV